MLSKLTAQDNKENQPFKPKIYQGKKRGQARNFYDQDRYQHIDIDQTVVIGECHIEVELSVDKILKGRSQYDQNFRGDYRKGNFRGMQNYRGQNFRDGYRGNFRNDNWKR